MDSVYTGRNTNDSTIFVLSKTLKREGYSSKMKREERYRLCAGFKGMISDMKHDQRMLRKYLMRTNGY